MARAQGQMREFTPVRNTYGSLAYAEAMPAYERGGAEILRPQPRVRTRERVIARPKVRVREAEGVSVFAVIGFIAVFVCAALLLLSYVRLTVASDQVVSMNRQLSTLQAEQTKLVTEYELAYDLSTIEAKVTQDGSMMKASAGQIFALDLSASDSVLHYTAQDDAQKKTTSFADVWENVVEYFR